MPISLYPGIRWLNGSPGLREQEEIRQQKHEDGHFIFLVLADKEDEDRIAFRPIRTNDGRSGTLFSRPGLNLKRLIRAASSQTSSAAP